MRTVFYFFSLIILQSCASQADFSKYIRKENLNKTLVCMDSAEISTEGFIPASICREVNGAYIQPFGDDNWLYINEFSKNAFKQSNFLNKHILHQTPQGVFYSFKDTVFSPLFEKGFISNHRSIFFKPLIKCDSSNHTLYLLNQLSPDDLGKKTPLFLIYNYKTSRSIYKKKYPKFITHGIYTPWNAANYSIHDSLLYIQYGGLPYIDVFTLNFKKVKRIGCINPAHTYTDQLLKKNSKRNSTGNENICEYLKSLNGLNFIFYPHDAYNNHFIAFSDEGDTYFKGNIGAAYPLYFTSDNELIVLEAYPGFQLKKFVLKEILSE